MSKRVLKVLGIIVVVGVMIFAGIQLLRPSVTNHNPPVGRQAVWSSTEGEAIARRACFDCHSNETVWPWYSQIAPVSWLVANDVVGGRDTFNFSDWGAGHPGADQFGEEIAEGGMPLPQYLLMHPGARLTDAEKETLIAALRALQ